MRDDDDDDGDDDGDDDNNDDGDDSNGNDNDDSDDSNGNDNDDSASFLSFPFPSLSSRSLSVRNSDRLSHTIHTPLNLFNTLKNDNEDGWGRGWCGDRIRNHKLE
ncbi:uncharacterized protein EAE98_004858 [Botrytis deweyae]|uniref:Uncharacterized protein n=1 Tax=Botrytis deweyae TaxID=2478750 RepID=A0ABQ7IPI7_9HELO|nr:uncharacterized protein EAE98_004858 [Botrytis deweyae]KAF7930458.1 hypothetical protein EAE98_004858 [Botrytis deweyae]